MMTLKADVRGRLRVLKVRKGATRTLWERESRERDESQPYFQVAEGVPSVMSLFLMLWYCYSFKTKTKQSVSVS